MVAGLRTLDPEALDLESALALVAAFLLTRTDFLPGLFLPALLFAGLFLDEVVPFLLAAFFPGLVFFSDGSLLAMQSQAPMGHPIIQPAFVPEPQERHRIDSIYRRESSKRSSQGSEKSEKPRLLRGFHRPELRLN